MKNLLIILFSVITLSTSLSAFSDAPFISKLNKRSFVLDVSTWASKTVVLSISDLNNVSIYKEIISTDQRLRKFNLGKLNVGTYTVTVENDIKQRSQTVEVFYKNIKVSDKSVELFKPSMKFKENRLSLNYLVFGKPFTLSIIDSDYLQIYSKKYKNIKAFAKGYDLKGLKPGKYTALVRQDDKTYSYSFLKQEALKTNYNL